MTPHGVLLFLLLGYHDYSDRSDRANAGSHTCDADRCAIDVGNLASWRNEDLFWCSQAGLVNNLNDGMSWGIYPLFLASFGLGVAHNQGGVSPRLRHLAAN